MCMPRFRRRDSWSDLQSVCFQQLPAGPGCWFGFKNLLHPRSVAVAVSLHQLRIQRFCNRTGRFRSPGLLCHSAECAAAAASQPGLCQESKHHHSWLDGVAAGSYRDGLLEYQLGLAAWTASTHGTSVRSTRAAHVRASAGEHANCQTGHHSPWILVRRDHQTGAQGRRLCNAGRDLRGVLPNNCSLCRCQAAWSGFVLPAQHARVSPVHAGFGCRRGCVHEHEAPGCGDDGEGPACCVHMADRVCGCVCNMLRSRL
mmetsp:Transcript_87116/g.172940  ORF Transcript_87116/g.172940 Transcript_87116/m.172940 type:complete len:257 (+) Transcript_87116:691-1461(+)